MRYLVYSRVFPDKAAIIWFECNILDKSLIIWLCDIFSRYLVKAWFYFVLIEKQINSSYVLEIALCLNLKMHAVGNVEFVMPGWEARLCSSVSICTCCYCCCLYPIFLMAIVEWKDTCGVQLIYLIYFSSHSYF